MGIMSVPLAKFMDLVSILAVFFIFERDCLVNSVFYRKLQKSVFLAILSDFISDKNKFSARLIDYKILKENQSKVHSFAFHPSRSHPLEILVCSLVYLPEQYCKV